MPDIEKQKQEFLTLCRENIHREGLEDLLTWLQKSDFFTAPASTRYHGAYEGGLCEHSLDVYRMAKKAIAGYELQLAEESVVIAALFHDLCKVNFYRKDMRNQKINGEWQEVPCYTVEEKFCFGGHGSKSVFLVQQFMKLKTDEGAAINCHMGSTPGGDAVRDSGNAFMAFPLAWVIHVADEAATYLLKR
ncbi:MAG: HD domain-containing protein [Clostridia bacterium]|nr:HD domain-containing protein [Clostridia bacterium]